MHYPDTNQDGCKAFKTEDFKSDPLFDERRDMTPIIMVDRGKCTFVTKVRNIEHLGVKMAVIADHREEHSESLIMADDGSGWSIKIPSFIIRKSDGQKIKNVLSSGKHVYIRGHIKMVRYLTLKVFRRALIIELSMICGTALFLT